MTAFIAREGALAGQRFELEGERTIGREGADITLDDDQVSRRHARLSVSGDAIVIEDLGSTNGTFVNDRKIEGATVLAPGDTVRIGTTTFALEAEPEPEPEPVPAMPEPVVTVAREATPAAPPPAPEPEPAPAAPVAQAPVLTGTVGAPREPFGAYLAPETSRHGGGIQSRQRGPILVTYAIVLGVAIALAVYFAYV